MSNMSYAGVGHAEAQNRTNEHRTGVPTKGVGAPLLRAPLKRFAAVDVLNSGEDGAELRLRVQGKVKTQTNELLTAHNLGSNKFAGRLQFGAIVAGTVSITNGGAPATVVDNGAGKLVDTGTTTERGTINYTTGEYVLQYGGAPTAPVRATYNHKDWTDFEFTPATTTKAAAAYPFTVKTAFGRVVPGSVTIVDDAGAPDFADDGKGNIVETTVGQEGVRGTIDYATGDITILSDGGAVNLAGTVVVTYKYNPFAALVAAAGGQKLTPVYSAIPEITNEAWADGVKGETYVGLWGVSRTQGKATNLVTLWEHYGEDPWRVDELFSSFSPGGFANDPATAGATEHL